MVPLFVMTPWGYVPLALSSHSPTRFVGQALVRAPGDSTRSPFGGAGADGEKRRAIVRWDGRWYSERSQIPGSAFGVGLRLLGRRGRRGRGRLANEANFPIFRLGRIWCGGIVVGLVLPADSLAAFEFGEVGEEGALGFNDVTMEALEGFGIGCEAGAEIRAPFGFVGDAGGVVDEVGGEEAVAAKEPIVSDEDIDEDAFDDAGGLELAVVLGGESGEGGGVSTVGGFVSGVDAGFEGVQAGDSLALFGARTGQGKAI